MTPIEVFVRQVRARTTENRKAIGLLHTSNLPGHVVGILRHEVDSLVRVIYILSKSDRAERTRLILASNEGQKWTVAGTRKRITDRDMVDIAQNLHGWTESVYSFGCAFIHLSNFHDHRHRDPMTVISSEERHAIAKHLRQYHGGPIGNNPSFQDLIPYLPMVFDKIAGNLECYLQAIEKDKELDEW